MAGLCWSSEAVPNSVMGSGDRGGTNKLRSGSVIVTEAAVVVVLGSADVNGSCATIHWVIICTFIDMIKMGRMGSLQGIWASSSTV